VVVSLEGGELGDGLVACEELVVVRLVMGGAFLSWELEGLMAGKKRTYCGHGEGAGHCAGHVGVFCFFGWLDIWDGFWVDCVSDGASRWSEVLWCWRAGSPRSSLRMSFFDAMIVP